MTNTPIKPTPDLHMPWRMHSEGIPYVICGRRGPSFGPVTFAGTPEDMLTIATLMHAAPDLLAMCEAWVAEWSGFSADELHRRVRMGFEVSHLAADTVSRILATRAAIKRAKGEG